MNEYDTHYQSNKNEILSYQIILIFIKKKSKNTYVINS